MWYTTASRHPSSAWRARGRHARWRVRGTGNWVNFLTLKKIPPLNADIILIRQGFIFFNLRRAVRNYLEITSQYNVFPIVLPGSVNFISHVLNLVSLYLVHPCATWHYSVAIHFPIITIARPCLVYVACAGFRMHAMCVWYFDHPFCMALARLLSTWGRLLQGVLWRPLWALSRLLGLKFGNFTLQFKNPVKWGNIWHETH